jgi:hypothetical protein
MACRVVLETQSHRRRLLLVPGDGTLIGDAASLAVVLLARPDRGDGAVVVSCVWKWGTD